MPAAMQEAAMDLMQKQVVNGHLEAALVQVEATLRYVLAMWFTTL